ncbi:MAG TPA: ABC transporter ATP-binding protein [Acetobacteraceae bacterium]|nr:ABC transporter ATP-binding protein [Acetobacteraceae bacterium]
MARPIVEAVALGRDFPLGGQTVQALLPASFRVQAGDRIALTGASGSGKSTLLHLMAGLDAPTGGGLCWPALGAPPEKAWALRPGKIGMVFQAASLLPMLDLAENVALPLLLGGKAQGARERAVAALDAVGLGGLADKLPEELSGGQAQRVGLARALVGAPKLILADEPTGQLDHATAQHVFDVLLAALEGSDTALVVATHDPVIAARLRTVWQMAHGSLRTEQE